ncbi:hypothetical protein F3P66_12135 [Agrobacterium fabrum]|uniref:Uncharacterized protein n=1 Tax=Agrobacterium fabrum (strain C58 / ATCC 33970) TaxID=176299 RepID=Q8UI33_AGRFC|nr:hypothetical protein Atu0467 [Agrobacterium fabrum str. C58]QRM60102.1 hypothetical protein F3P66_12135 [Agrobacterium fabrum]TRB31543.1 hypothetical protein EXN51_05280 [Agrobacterium fabrum]
MGKGWQSSINSDLRKLSGLRWRPKRKKPPGAARAAFLIAKNNVSMGRH